MYNYSLVLLIIFEHILLQSQRSRNANNLLIESEYYLFLILSVRPSRLERVDVKKLHSMAKVIGTIVTVIGAMVMTLYKGPIIDIIKSRGLLHQTNNNNHQTDSDQHWITGTLMLLVSCGGWAIFFILQVYVCMYVCMIEEAMHISWSWRLNFLISYSLIMFVLFC